MTECPDRRVVLAGHLAHRRSTRRQAGTRSAGGAPPQPRITPGPVAGGQGYSRPSTRQYLSGIRIPHMIPERSDQIARRKAKGSHGGRPPKFDPEIYRHRNSAERGFNRLKHWRGTATRYDKYALTFLGGAVLAALVTHHRVRNQQTRLSRIQAPPLSPGTSPSPRRCATAWRYPPKRGREHEWRRPDRGGGSCCARAIQACTAGRCRR